MSLISELSVSKANFEGLEVNKRKMRHGFSQKDGKLKKKIPDFTQLSPLEICKRNIVVTVSIFSVQLGFEFKVR